MAVDIKLEYYQLEFFFMTLGYTLSPFIGRILTFDLRYMLGYIEQFWYQYNVLYFMYEVLLK